MKTVEVMLSIDTLAKVRHEAKRLGKTEEELVAFFAAEGVSTLGGYIFSANGVSTHKEAK